MRQTRTFGRRETVGQHADALRTAALHAEAATYDVIGAWTGRQAPLTDQLRRVAREIGERK